MVYSVVVPTVIVLCVVYVGVLLTLWRFQERVVFQPPRGVAAEDVAARRVTYAAVDGTSLFAYIVGDLLHASVVVLAFHGNADLARWFVPWARDVATNTGAAVVLPEYRGYDGLAGVPTYEGSALDARAALALVRDALAVPPDRLVYFGHSLGSAIAAELAAVIPPRALILQAPLSSARAMAQRMWVPGLTQFWRWISRVHFDTAACVAALGIPVWVAHGERDGVTPAWMGQAVFQAAARKGKLLLVPTAGHNDIAESGGPAYWGWLRGAVGADSSRSAIIEDEREGDLH